MYYCICVIMLDKYICIYNIYIIYIYYIYICIYMGLWMVRISKNPIFGGFFSPNFQIIGSPDPPIDFWLELFGTKMLPWRCFPCHLSKIFGVSYQNPDLEGVGSAKPTFLRFFENGSFSVIEVSWPPYRLLTWVIWY